MILLIDNYDSFTFNLVQVLQIQGVHPEVLRNDHPDLVQRAQSPDIRAVILSPGPGRPENAGYCMRILENLPPDIPVMGVCLGHQALALFSGSRIRTGERIMHGKTSLIRHNENPIFAGLDNPFPACRYHSLLAEEKTGMEITATSEEGEIMGLKLTDRPWFGVQFHPESILTPDGPQLMRNFLNTAQSRKQDKEALCT